MDQKGEASKAAGGGPDREGAREANREVFANKNAAFIENLRVLYAKDPSCVPQPWHAFLGALDTAPLNPKPNWQGRPHAGSPAFSKVVSSDVQGCTEQSDVRTFLRDHGFCFAHTNPLQPPKALPPKIEAHLNHPSLAFLRTAYTGSLALEVPRHTKDEERAFLYEAFEQNQEGKAGEARFNPGSTQQKEAYVQLLRAHLFEAFMGKNFQGLKRFSLEGAEALLPALGVLLPLLAKENFAHLVMGMAHRGRLTVKALFFDAPVTSLLKVYKDTGDVATKNAAALEEALGFSDVPYHLGVQAKKVIDEKSLLCTLLPNPSHLESVNPVVLGYAAAEKRLSAKAPFTILVHGDAAFAGQGVVSESLLLGQLSPYGAEGTLHVIVDNQVGFTATPLETHARGTAVPTLHVNGLDQDAVLRGFITAFHFRMRFKSDIAVRLLCFRRHGHNEMDEPRFTNPLMYQKIEKIPPLFETYGAHLKKHGVMDDAMMQQEKATFKTQLQRTFDAKKPFSALTKGVRDAFLIQQKGQAKVARQGPTIKALKKLGESLIKTPKNFVLHPKIERFLKVRSEMLYGAGAIDFSTAEALALAFLLKEGAFVRFSGQDSVRGTFTQRHAAFVDQKTEERFFPLSQFAKTPQHFQLFNTPLSEEACLGFEMGYTWRTQGTHPHKALTLWEAQFGDFFNGAQIQVDQYLASAFAKWGVASNLTLLLPHGYEGQGPEHSSARLERFLQLAAQNNMKISMPASPATVFHLLLQQVDGTQREGSISPLILLTPKSLLRHVRARTSFAVLEKPFAPLLLQKLSVHKKPVQPKRILLCAGKVFYDLWGFYEEFKNKKALGDTLLVGFEQLYPFPKEALLKCLKLFLQDNPDVSLAWVQEEPQNMGAAAFVQPHLSDLSVQMGLKAPFYVSRKEAASPATGFFACHKEEMQAIMRQAFGVHNSV